MRRLAFKPVLVLSRKFSAGLAGTVLLLFLSAAGAHASYDYTFTITAAQIVGAIQATGDQLSTADAVYAISHLIIKPDGLTSYTLSNPVTSVPGWTNPGGDTPRITSYAYAYDPTNYQANKYAEYYFPLGMAPGYSTANVITDQSNMSRFPTLFEHDNNYTIGKAPCCSNFTFTVDSATAWNGSVKFYVEGYKYPSNYHWDPANYYSPDNITEKNFAPIGSALYDLQHNQNGGYSAMMSADPVCPVPVPGTVWLFGSGLVGLIGFGIKFRAVPATIKC